MLLLLWPSDAGSDELKYRSNSSLRSADFLNRVSRSDGMIDDRWMIDATMECTVQSNSIFIFIFFDTYVKIKIRNKK